MQIARVDLSLGRGGAADSRACFGAWARDRIVFYGLGLGVAWADSRESLGKGLGAGFGKGGLQDLQKVCKNGAILRYNLR